MLAALPSAPQPDARLLPGCPRCRSPFVPNLPRTLRPTYLTTAYPWSVGSCASPNPIPNRSSVLWPITWLVKSTDGIDNAYSLSQSAVRMAHAKTAAAGGRDCCAVDGRYRAEGTDGHSVGLVDQLVASPDVRLAHTLEERRMGFDPLISIRMPKLARSAGTPRQESDRSRAACGPCRAGR